jgi:hypothetical protein
LRPNSVINVSLLLEAGEEVGDEEEEEEEEEDEEGLY